MKKILVFLCAILLFFGMTGMANATLFDRGNGLIYDDVLDITWLQDANYAQTSGYDLDGKMDDDVAVAWADSLDYGGYDDWRLPETLPVDGSSYDFDISFDGSTDNGFNISAPGSAYPESTASEMAYMFYVNLENLGYYDTSVSEQSGWGLNNVSFIDGVTGEARDFQNLQSSQYWSGTESSPYIGFWYFDFDDGQQFFDYFFYRYAWPVRDGDVAPVPEPATMLLLGSGLIGLAGFRRKYKK